MICCSASGVGRVLRIEKTINNKEVIIVEFERPFLGLKDKIEYDYLPLLDWNDETKIFSNYIEEKDVIAFKGRVETRENIGVVIVCEQIRIIVKVKK